MISLVGDVVMHEAAADDAPEKKNPEAWIQHEVAGVGVGEKGYRERWLRAMTSGAYYHPALKWAKNTMLTHEQFRAGIKTVEEHHP